VNALRGDLMSSTDYSIRVDVVTNFVEEQSNPSDGRFVFAYTITIRNEGTVPARLLSPHLQPGEGFRYSSGAILETPVGAMQGKYRMVADDGEHFDAPVAPFRLAVPGLLH
jgi:ApaG protein